MAQIVTFEDARRIFTDFSAQYRLEAPQVITEKGDLVVENPNLKIAARPDTFSGDKTNVSVAIVTSKNNLQPYLNPFWIPLLNEIIRRNGSGFGSGKCAEYLFGKPLLQEISQYCGSDSFFMGRFSASGNDPLERVIESVYLADLQFSDLTKSVQELIKNHLPGYMP